ncbi:hypothetical protein RRG08_029879 [Elysia crispata]|uniref:Uncharacterized protein n=1 Tax=Elysia crispata TaxID=231223 RepID=A0AAE0YJB9_9GAST|nr:hypothetical protein RRG08_029879 [Elysia crispata]
MCRDSLSEGRTGPEFTQLGPHRRSKPINTALVTIILTTASEYRESIGNITFCSGRQCSRLQACSARSVSPVSQAVFIALLRATEPWGINENVSAHDIPRSEPCLLIQRSKLGVVKCFQMAVKCLRSSESTEERDVWMGVNTDALQLKTM